MGIQISKPLHRAISNGNLDEVVRLSQGLDDIRLMIGFDLAFKKNHNQCAIALAIQVTKPNMFVQRKCFEAFLDLCDIEDWKEIQPWIELIHIDNIEAGVRRAIDANNTDAVRHLFEYYPISTNNFTKRMLSVVSAEGNGMVRLFIEHNPPRDHHRDFLHHLAINSDELDLMHGDMVDFLAAYFTEEEMVGAAKYMEEKIYLLCDKDQVQQSRAFFTKIVATQQNTAITQEVDGTMQSARRTSKM